MNGRYWEVKGLKDSQAIKIKRKSREFSKLIENMKDFKIYLNEVRTTTWLMWDFN